MGKLLEMNYLTVDSSLVPSITTIITITIIIIFIQFVAIRLLRPPPHAPLPERRHGRLQEAGPVTQAQRPLPARRSDRR